MVKEIVILTKSKKYYNYCIAGMDLSNNRWIRLVSDDISIRRAVPRKDIIYNDGKELEILDVVKVHVKSCLPEAHQVENWLYDSTFKWQKVGKMTIDKVYKDLIQENEPYIFYNSDRRVSANEITKSPIKYSLKLAKIDLMKIWCETYEKEKFRAQFTYNGVEYNRIAITDMEFNKRLSNKCSSTVLENVYVVFSLGEEYTDGYYYKLIASIISTKDTVAY